MELNFIREDNYWIAEFEASGNFNLHIERNTEGGLQILQKTSGNRPAIIRDSGYLDKLLVFDDDFSGLIYPKQVLVKSFVKPQVAIVTFA
jgi:hypothetical protein